MNDFQSEDRYDVIVVGSGATGGWAAKILTEGGARVLLLEVGQQAKSIPVGTGPERVVLPQAEDFAAMETYPYQADPAGSYLWRRMRTFGGRTVFWNRMCMRLSDFEMKAASFDGHGQDWPISQQDLSSHYAEAERFFGVHGARDGLVQLPDGELQPAAEFLPADATFRKSCEASFPGARVIANRGIPIAKPWYGGCSALTSIPSARATGRLTVRLGAAVSHVEMDAATRQAKGVAFVDTETQRTFVAHARAVVLAASTIESTRLLLNSGIGKTSGLLGQGLMDHVISSVQAFVPEKKRASGPRRAGGPYSVLVPRFRGLFGDRASFRRGYGIAGYFQRSPWDRVSAWAGYATCRLVGYGEVLAYPRNRVEIDSQRKDRWGIPQARLSFAWSENDKALAEDMKQTMRRMIAAMGGKIVSEEPTLPPIGNWALHEVGTAPFGNSPDRSVLDPFNRCWDAPNVLVVDGAAWPSSAWQPPTLTMLAVAGRASRKLLADLGGQRP